MRKPAYIGLATVSGVGALVTVALAANHVAGDGAGLGRAGRPA